jgi:hypothetical protein
MSTIRRSHVSLVLILTILSALATSASVTRAQDSTSGAHSTNHDALIKGIVTSEKIKPLKNARVTLFNLATDEKTDTKTDKKGKFKFSNLFSGDYRIEVKTETGEAVTDQIRLRAGETLIRKLVAKQPS